MNNMFLSWVKDREAEFLEKKIKCEVHNPQSDLEVDNSCQTVYFDSEVKFGTISVWKSGFLDAEILDSESEEIEYYKHFDDIGGDPNFDQILSEFFLNMG